MTEMSPPKGGRFVGPGGGSAADPVAHPAIPQVQTHTDAERELQGILRRLGFAQGHGEPSRQPGHLAGHQPNVEHSLGDLLRRTLAINATTTMSVRVAEAARLLALWMEAVPATIVRVAELGRCEPGLIDLGRNLFTSSVRVSERPGAGGDPTRRAVADLSAAAEALGARYAGLIARPLVAGMLSIPGERPADRFAEAAAWRQLASALTLATEGGAGSLLGVAMLDAGRNSDAPEAARLRDVVGAATADGIQALYRRFEEIARERSELERRAGLDPFGLAGLSATADAERALLAIEDRDGVVERYDLVADRVRRIHAHLASLSAGAPGFTLEFGPGRLLELANAVER